MSSDDSENQGDGEIPFDDRPGPARVVRARREPGSPDEPPAGGPSPADAGPSPEDAPRTEGRDRSRPGSTGPTGMREDLGTLAEEARKLWSVLEARVIGPAVQTYPEVTRHLGAAGRELLAAYRTAVRGQEQAWRDPASGPRQEKITVERVDSGGPAGPQDATDARQKNRD